jgi:hypothetical protein
MARPPGNPKLQDHEYAQSNARRAGRAIRMGSIDAPKMLPRIGSESDDLTLVNPADYDKYKTLEAKFTQQLKEIQLKKEQGELLTKAEVVEAQQEILQRLRAHLLRLSTTIKSRLAEEPRHAGSADAAMRVADEAVRDMLESLAASYAG